MAREFIPRLLNSSFLVPRSSFLFRFPGMPPGFSCDIDGVSDLPNPAYYVRGSLETEPASLREPILIPAQVPANDLDRELGAVAHLAVVVGLGRVDQCVQAAPCRDQAERPRRSIADDCA
jgi:hypothetical protein